MSRGSVRFKLLAQTADGFAQANGESRDRFEALLATGRETTVIFAAHFRQQ